MNSGPIEPGRASAADGQLCRAVDARLAQGAVRAGHWLACRPGCTACCIGPFPLSWLDADRLRRGLADLHRTDPTRARRVVERAARSAARLLEAFPGDTATGALAADEGAEEAFCEQFADEPCPALDPASGCCDLYDARPLSCRTYGLPVRDGGVDLPPCTLCFVGADASHVERCRVEPDPDDLEGRLLEAAEADIGVSARMSTVVALALRPGASGQHGVGDEA